MPLLIDKRKVLITGSSKSGKSELINQLLKKLLLPINQSTTLKEVLETNIMECTTQYPITIVHDEQICLEKYINNKLIERFVLEEDVKNVLKLRGRINNDDFNIHFLLKCPFKEGCEDLILTDMMDTCVYKELTRLYINYCWKQMGTSFQLDEIIYVLNEESVDNKLKSDLESIDILYKMCKIGSYKLNILYCPPKFSSTQISKQSSLNINEMITTMLDKLNITIDDVNVRFDIVSQDDRKEYMLHDRYNKTTNCAKKRSRKEDKDFGSSTKHKRMNTSISDQEYDDIIL